MTETPDPAIAALAVQLAALKDNLGQAREDLETARRELAARIDQLASSLATEAERRPERTTRHLLARPGRRRQNRQTGRPDRMGHRHAPMAPLLLRARRRLLGLPPRSRHRAPQRHDRIHPRLPQEPPPARRHPAPVRPVAPRHAPPLPRRHEILRPRRMLQDTTAHVQAALQMRTRMPPAQPRPPARTPGAPAPARARPCNPRAETTRNQATTTWRR